MSTETLPFRFGGILHDSLGRWVSGFFGYCMHTTYIKAALQAIYHGLNLAWTNGYRRVKCETDLATAIHLIFHVDVHFHPLVVLINLLRSFINRE